ncbi:AAA family ATPase [Corynebacterium sp. 32222D000AT]|uniref:AAA family ATPase n=1 Tax=unclassified Corynebacterium TaxID=2624378 RepID=UPI002A9EEE3A|nr:AAA family ATPase [Mycobacteriaceae bacterium]MDY5829309.1 AAA family ATPase [Corynebacterium sp.]
MRIHSLELRNVRAVEHLKLEDLPDQGVVVIHGDNEAGKSTLVEAIGVVLKQAHSSHAKNTVGVLRPVGKDASPEITLEATVGPYRFRIFKRWFRKQAAELTVFSPRPENHTGRAADARLKEILDEHLDDDLLDALFLKQDDLGAAVEAVGISSLRNALEQSSGSQALSEGHDSGLMDRVEEEYKRYFTGKKGEPTGEYKRAGNELSAAQDAAEQAQRELTELEGYVRDYERAVDRREQAAQEQGSARSELEQRTAELTAAQQARAAFQAKDKDFVQAQESHQRAGEDLRGRQELVEDLKRNQEQLQAAREDLAPVVQQAAEADQRLEQVRQRAAEAAKVVSDARQRRKDAAGAHKLVVDRNRLAKLDSLLGRIDEVSEKLGAVRQEIAAREHTVTEKQLADIDQLAQDVQLHQRLQEAAQSKLFFSSASGEEITVDGQSYALEAGGEELEVPVADGTELVIGTLSARFAAGQMGESVRSAREEYAHAKRRLEDLLESLGCDGAAEARGLREEQVEQDQRAERLRHELDTLAAGDDIEQLRAEHRALQEFFEGEQTEELPDVDTAAATLAAAEEAEEQAQTEQEEAAAAVAREEELNLSEKLLRSQVKVDSLQEAVERAEQSLARARGHRGDEELEQAVEAAQERLAAAQAARAKAQAEMNAADPERAEQLHAGAQAHLKSLEETWSQADRTIATLTGYIERDQGSAERAEKAQAQFENAQDRFDSLDRRAKAVKYLREVLLRHREEARRKYSAPFADRLSRLARRVYGGDVEFQLNEKLEVTQRTQDDVTIDLGELSGGAREQLAILTRFAIAELVEESAGGGDEAGARPVPVVIDDALGSTDSERIQLMSTLFSEVGKRAQVIVLTCMPQRYSRVPGKLELDIEDLKRAD